MNTAQPSIEVLPITDIPFPPVDLRKVVDPIQSILEHPHFEEARRYFRESPSAERSLMPDLAQALLYSLVRNAVPSHVVEIGTWRGGTTEGLARAVQANGIGVVHTVSPYDEDRFQPTYQSWPEPLRKVCRVHVENSMGFFMRADAQKIRPDIVLVDGNHDYEFALFDIEASARRLTRGGFLIIDNVAQAGPYLAAKNFHAANADWHDCGKVPTSTDDTKAFDSSRARVPYTDFIIYRAPFNYFIGRRPITFGEVDVPRSSVKGIRIATEEITAPGTLYMQIILRAFAPTRVAELPGDLSCSIELGAHELELRLAQPLTAGADFDRYQVETWFVWKGESPLPLRTLPTPF